MPSMSLDTADAIELAELLQFIVGWLAAEPATLTASLLAYVGHPASGPRTLRADLDRFAFLLGGNDGEPLFEARARLTDSGAAGVLYWFRRSSSYQTQIPISGITLDRRSR
jgi:hypothetical protein